MTPAEEDIHLETLRLAAADSIQALSDPGLVRAMETVRQKALTQIEQSEPQADGLRDTAYHVLLALRAIQEDLGRHVRAYEDERKRIARVRDPKRVDRTIRV